MLKLLQDLINEHGSSTILKERLELIGDRYSHLEEQLAASQEENEKLKGELRDACVEIEGLQRRLDTAENKRDDSGLDDDAKRMLRLLFESDDMSVEQISSQLEVDLAMVEYYRDLLQERGFVQIGSVIAGSPFTGDDGFMGWRITAEGRKFVVAVIGRE